MSAGQDTVGVRKIIASCRDSSRRSRARRPRRFDTNWRQANRRIVRVVRSNNVHMSRTAPHEHLGGTHSRTSLAISLGLRVIHRRTDTAIQTEACAGHRRIAPDVRRMWATDPAHIRCPRADLGRPLDHGAAPHGRRLLRLAGPNARGLRSRSSRAPSSHLESRHTASKPPRRSICRINPSPEIRLTVAK